ncbi:MAG TPA: dockerin type I domain-containing protein, partial [Planctomycetota bacterium]|nr:dockerin type I domain-containing protein [Planctomycetota bacterium]
APNADVNVDGSVNILDLIAIRNGMGKVPGSSASVRCDVNEDGRINILDLITVRNKLNTHWP